MSSVPQEAQRGNEYKGYRLARGPSGRWLLWHQSTVTPLDNLTPEQLLILHHLNGGDCGDDSCKCWASGFEQRQEYQRENGRPL